MVMGSRPPERGTKPSGLQPPGWCSAGGEGKGFEREAGRGRAPYFWGELRERGRSSRLLQAAPHTHGSRGGCRAQAVSCCSSTFSCRVRDRHPAALSTGGAFLPWKLCSVERKQKRGGEGGVGDTVPSSRSRGPQELGAERGGKRGHRRLKRSQTTQEPRLLVIPKQKRVWKQLGSVLPSISPPCIYLFKGGDFSSRSGSGEKAPSPSSALASLRDPLPLLPGVGVPKASSPAFDPFP